jgi:hypothetical protein
VISGGEDIFGKNKKNTVNISPMYLVVGITGSLFFLLCILSMWIFPNGTESLFAYIVSGLFVILGIIIILYCLLWRIEYDDESFTYRNLLGHKTIVPYSSVIRIKRKLKDVYLFTEKKRFDIIQGTIGVDDFMDMIAKHALVVHYDNVQPKKHRHKRTERKNKDK